MDPSTVSEPSSPDARSGPARDTADPSGPPAGTTSEAGTVPSASPGRSSLAWVGLADPATTAPTTAVVAQGPGAAARPSSSATTASSTIPAPWPPNSSGRWIPSVPWAPRSAQKPGRRVRVGIERGPGHLGRAARLHPALDRQPELVVLVTDPDGHRSGSGGMRPVRPTGCPGGDGATFGRRSERPVRSRSRRVSTIPATLTRTGSSSGPIISRSTGPELGYQPLNTGGRRSAKALRPSWQSSVPVTSSWATASSHRAVARSDSRDRLVRYLAAAMALVGPAASRAAQAPASAEQLVAGDHPVDQAQPLGLGGRDVVAEEEQLLGLLGTDQAGQQVGASGVGGDAPPDEHRDELGLFGRHHQVAGQGQVHPATGRGGVDGGDDRLLAVEHGPDQALPPVADEPGRIPHGRSGAPGRAGPGPGPGSAGRRRCRTPSPRPR